MWELDHKEDWALKNWCFQTVVLEKTLESPLDSKDIKPVNPNGNQAWIFIGWTDAKVESPIYFGHLVWKANSFEKTLMLDKIESKRRKGWQRIKWFLKKLEIELPYDPAIPLLGIHTKETRSERDTCTPMFIAALFLIARAWKQPRCPSADEWIRKLWYIYTKEYYSAIKKNSFESVQMRWMKLEPIIQSEVSQKDKDHYSILTHIYGI